MLQYEIMFEKLRQDADVKDLDEFIEIFKKQEEENKVLYDKANALSEEVENRFFYFNLKVLYFRLKVSSKNYYRKTRR